LQGDGKAEMMQAARLWVWLNGRSQGHECLEGREGLDDRDGTLGYYGRDARDNRPQLHACFLEVGRGHCTPYMESDAAQLPLSHKAWAWFEANRKQALLGAGAVVVLGAIVGFYFYQQNEQERAAAEALSSVAVPQMTGARGAPEPAAAYLKIAADYPKTSAAARAVLLAAGNFFLEGKYTEAKAQFERFTREHGDSPFMGQALLGIAACQDALGKTNEAMVAYNDLVRQHPNENVVPQARFALGRLYEAQNDPDKARNQFEEVAKANPYGSLGSEAGMRVEELNLKYPKLVPLTPPPTNAVPIRIEKK
jgi:predicted negative regulator of RcsB-dependent stress response